MPDDASHEPTIEDYLTEERVFPPPPGFRARAVVADPGVYEEAAALGPEFWAHQAGALDWFRPWDTVLSVGPAVRPLVRRRDPQRLLQLPRPPRGRRPGRQGGLPLGGRAGRHPDHQLRRPAGRGVPVRQRAARPRRGPGRPGGHLHADDPRAGRGHAGLHPDRRRPLGRVRRASPPTPCATGSSTPRPGWWSPPTAGGAGARRSASRATSTSAVSETPCVDHVVVVAPDRRRHGGRPAGHDGRPGPLVARAADGRGPGGRRRAGRHLRAGAHGRRGPALHPLHLGHHGGAQGHHAHHRRLPDPGGLHPPGGLRPAPRRGRLLVRGRHRLGHRPQLHRLRAAGQRRDLGDVRGDARHARAATAGGRSSSATG